MIGLIGSLMLGPIGVMQLKAAERIEVQFEDMSIPISIKELTSWVEGMSLPDSIKELADWARDGKTMDSELAAWLNLLDLESRAGLVKLLQAPLIKDISMARQMLRSWVGRELLDEVSDLVRLDDDRSGQRVFSTLESLLASQSQVSTLDLLKELPAESILLDLDALLKIATRWRTELKNQQKLLVFLSNLSKKNPPFEKTPLVTNNLPVPVSEKQPLFVSHRSTPLTLELWKPSIGATQRKAWVVFMPGLGGAQEHFRWLARSLSREGWPVVLLEHPGSDPEAVKDLLEGRSTVPGAEVLPDRLEDLYEVLKAQAQGELDVSGEKLILMGHSLGALTTFFAAGATPEPGLAIRCEEALDDLSLTNLSQLLQCQLIDDPLLKQKEIPQLSAIVALNSFGSLLWPSEGSAKLSIPVFLIGGTYDLVTPALSEQLGLMIATTPNKFSRTLLIEGASHFSPVRVESQFDQQQGDDLFQLGEALVGFQPLAVQSLLAKEIISFLENFEAGKGLSKFFGNEKKGLHFHILDRSTIKNLIKSNSEFEGQ